MTHTLLHIDSSARTTGSVTRQLTQAVSTRLGGTVIKRDLAQALPQIDDTWLAANWTDKDERDPVQRDLLALSDKLIDEVQQADTLVIGAPLYNFGIPASLKAWIDLICRAGLTFNYTENGPVGLMSGKRAIVVLATGGVPAGSAADHTTAYLRQVLGFIGITDVQFINADQVVARGDAAIETAQAEIDKIAA